MLGRGRERACGAAGFVTGNEKSFGTPGSIENPALIEISNVPAPWFHCGPFPKIVVPSSVMVGADVVCVLRSPRSVIRTPSLPVKRNDVASVTDSVFVAPGNGLLCPITATTRPCLYTSRGRA